MAKTRRSRNPSQDLLHDWKFDAGDRVQITAKNARLPYNSIGRILCRSVLAPGCYMVKCGDQMAQRIEEHHLIKIK